LPDAEARLQRLEERVAFIYNFIQILAVKDKSLRAQLERQKSETLRHSSKQKHVLGKAVDAGAGMEERLGRVERQISTLFDTMHRHEEIIKIGARPVRLKLKT